VAAELGVSLAAHRIGPGGGFADVEGRFAAVYGLEDGSAVLVRPDGFIAWRAPGGTADAEAATALGHTVRSILGRGYRATLRRCLVVGGALGSPAVGIVGTRVLLKEAARFLRGEGRYVENLPLEGARTATFVRSLLAHARITEVDASAAEALPDVQVLTAAD